LWLAETFNEFFYRKLKPDARPVEDPENPKRIVSGADCRMMAFETVSDATRLWIKGREFTVARLLGEAYRSEAERYAGGALAIFRLAPQDYHRFHSPVDGVIGPMTYISGEYYTVNVSVTSHVHDWWERC
jgi:phosphatidylserine decarboxylase